MRYLLILLFLSLFGYTLGNAAVGDKKKVLMQEKFSTYSTNRAAARIVDMNTVLPKTTFYQYTTSKRVVFTNFTATSVACFKANGNLGKCSSVVAATGKCTCQ